MENKIEALRDFLKSLNVRHLDISNYLEDYELEKIINWDVWEADSNGDAWHPESPFEVLTTLLNECSIFEEIYIMYYLSAMQYLTENDVTLTRAMEIAEGVGYTPKQLNSELLASLLAADIAREELNQKENEFNEFVYGLE